MCYNCGCFNPDDDMGNPDNLTNLTFKNLAGKWKKSEEEVKQEVYSALVNKTADKNADLKKAFAKAAAAWGQSPEEAMNQTYYLLKDELKK